MLSRPCGVNSMARHRCSMFHPQNYPGRENAEQFCRPFSFAQPVGFSDSYRRGAMMIFHSFCLLTLTDDPTSTFLGWLDNYKGLGRIATRQCYSVPKALGVETHTDRYSALMNKLVVLFYFIFMCEFLPACIYVHQKARIRLRISWNWN